MTVVNQILKALWLDELQKGQVIKIDLGIIELMLYMMGNWYL